MLSGALRRFAALPQQVTSYQLLASQPRQRANLANELADQKRINRLLKRLGLFSVHPVAGAGDAFELG